jgi:hypothetical protein
VHAREAKRRIEFRHDPREFDDVLHARLPGRIDEVGLDIEHHRVRRRYQHRTVDTAQARRERLGLRHVALHDFDVGQRRDRLGPGRIAHQRAHGNSAGRQHAQQFGPVQSGGACHEDHGVSPVRA